MAHELDPTRDPATMSDLAAATASEGGPPVAQVECPFCAEMISGRAKKCRHCGETVDVAMRKAEEAMRASERSSHVYMNAGGGAVASGGGVQQLRPFNHAIHIILSVITLGWWLPVYLLFYVLRNKSIYF
jgi:hypothetical protein